MPEMLLLGGLLLLLFGGKKLPELARSLGKSSKEFKKGMKEGGDPEDEEEPDEAKKIEEKKPES
jgi:sec-independent protein translocase protein TatA